jgi:GTP cyclohydrolase I
VAIDRERATRAVTELLEALGDDPKRAGLEKTPDLVVDALAELTRGIGVDASELITSLAENTPDGSRDTVVMSGLNVRSLCEHHLMPFTGIAHVAYLPGDTLCTLGSLARVVETVAAKPQIQERLGDEIADALMVSLGARGALVVLDMSHECMSARSVQHPQSRILTVAGRGHLSEPTARAEIIALLTKAESAKTPEPGA